MIRVQSLQDSMTTYNSDKDQEQHSHQNYRNIILLRYGIASTNQQEIGKTDIFKCILTKQLIAQYKTNIKCTKYAMPRLLE